MNILVLVNVDVLIACVLAFVFLLTHQELVYDYFFSILVGCYACIDEFNDFPYIFGLKDIWHDVRHNFTDLLEVFSLILDYSALKHLY